jgi:hypothetical protein
MTDVQLKDTYEFSVDPAEIELNRTLIEKVLGYRLGTAPEEVSAVIAEVLPHAPRHMQIRCGFTILPAERVRLADDAISCNGTTFATGSIIAKRLRCSQTVALFVATVGPGLEAWSKELMSGSDLLKGYIVDTVGSEAVEQVADWLEAKLADIVQSAGWRLTNRYSPGYCGWSVAEQQKLFSFLPEGFCGIRLTPTALMIPIKSVSGVIGVGPKARREAYQCSICDMEDCFRRRENEED